DAFEDQPQHADRSGLDAGSGADPGRHRRSLDRSPRQEIIYGIYLYIHRDPNEEEDKDLKQNRLNISALTGRVLKAGMGLLGIDVPEKM
ncbi:MAG: hypothetical protein EOO01_32050, partial [Chitinophagaceae bacterium]